MMAAGVAAGLFGGLTGVRLRVMLVLIRLRGGGVMAVVAVLYDLAGRRIAAVRRGLECGQTLQRQGQQQQPDGKVSNRFHVGAV